jgi:hypothetical protein
MELQVLSFQIAGESRSDHYGLSADSFGIGMRERESPYSDAVKNETRASFTYLERERAIKIQTAMNLTNSDSFLVDFTNTVNC